MCNQIEKIIKLDKEHKLKCEITGKMNNEHQLYFNETSIVCAEHRSGGGAGKPAEFTNYRRCAILQLEEPTNNVYYPIQRNFL